MTTLPDKPTALADLLAISTPYASQLLSGARPWPRMLSIVVYRKTGIRIGPIATATDDEIDVLERFERPATEVRTAA
jgi:DNA-binding transcriptional regulator YdaS (Cro superfamily)